VCLEDVFVIVDDDDGSGGEIDCADDSGGHRMTSLVSRRG
jgi:hypothetical protein